MGWFFGLVIATGGCLVYVSGSRLNKKLNKLPPPARELARWNYADIVERAVSTHQAKEIEFLELHPPTEEQK